MFSNKMYINECKRPDNSQRKGICLNSDELREVSYHFALVENNRFSIYILEKTMPKNKYILSMKLLDSRNACYYSIRYNVFN